MQQLSNLLKINVKINMEVIVVDMNKNKFKKFFIPKLGKDMLSTHNNMVVSLKIKNKYPLGSICTN